MGGPTVLMKNEEDEIAEAASLMVEWGYGIGNGEVMMIVQSSASLRNERLHFKMEYQGTTGGVVLEEDIRTLVIGSHRHYKYIGQKWQHLKR